MNYKFRSAKKEDKEFILKAHREINDISNLTYSAFEKNIDSDLFQKGLCKCIIIETANNQIGFLLYSYVYWADYGKGIYLSNAYIDKSYRGQGLFSKLLDELEAQEKDCKFITNMVGTENETMIKIMNKLSFKSFDLLNYYKSING